MMSVVLHVAHHIVVLHKLSLWRLSALIIDLLVTIAADIVGKVFRLLLMAVLLRVEDLLL